MDTDNDFWGALRTASGVQIQGELLQAWAGAGGGAGGNAIKSSSFPANPFSAFGDEKGAGGGGGAGSLTILSLGEIKLLHAGRIEAKGGTGGGGENSYSGGLTRIGGGSGGGSGGHVVLHSAQQIDLSQCRSANQGGIYALGGQGGAGANSLGGSKAIGTQTTPNVDALPPSAYPSSTNLATTTPCSMSMVWGGYGIGTAASNTLGNTSLPAPNGNHGNSPVTVVAGAGGDGGPGIIQLHAPSLADIIPPTSVGESLYKCVKPPPIGATPNNVNTPSAWDQLLPSFGPTSRAQSKWIALGSANVEATSNQLDAVDLRFGGTFGGFLQTARLAPILSGTLSSAPGIPFIASDQRTIVFGGAALADDIYLRNPALLRRFELELTHGGNTQSFEIGPAAYDAVVGALFVTVTRGGMPLAPFGPGDHVELRPRFFRVSSDGVLDTLASSSSIAIEFQAAPLAANGKPDEQVGALHASDWTADIDQIDAHPNAASFRFMRFRVRFELAVGGQPLTPSTPVPSLEFVRIPFRF